MGLSPAVQNIEDRAKATLLKNRKHVTKRGTQYGFTCPSTTLYHWQWLWDSCFHAIALRWFDPDFAKGELISLMSGQWADGRVPNMVHVGWNWRFDRVVHGTGRDSSGITQPPIIATAALYAHQAAPDKAFLEKMYAPMTRYYDWLRRHRETAEDGLIAVYHPWETGIDNSTRWDSIFGIRKFNKKWFNITKGLVMFRFNAVRYSNEWMMKVSPYFVKGIDMNCYYCGNLKAMTEIARILGKNDDAAMFAERAERTKAAIIARMWDAERRVFCDLIGKEQTVSYVPTPFSFLPMWAGIVDQRTADEMHADITNPKKFWTEFPIPTTAVDYPAFEADGYWRGTTWINTNWLTMEGLARYGFRDTANELKERTLRLVDKSGFHEYYNPFTGEGLGTADFGWSTLVIDMIHRDLMKDDPVVLP